MCQISVDIKTGPKSLCDSRDGAGEFWLSRANRRVWSQHRLTGGTSWFRRSRTRGQQMTDSWLKRAEQSAGSPPAALFSITTCSPQSWGLSRVLSELQLNFHQFPINCRCRAQHLSWIVVMHNPQKKPADARRPVLSSSPVLKVVTWGSNNSTLKWHADVFVACVCVYVCVQHQGTESGPQQQSGVSGEEGGGSAGQTGFSGEPTPAGRRQAEEPAGPGPGPHAHTADRGTQPPEGFHSLLYK